MYESLLKTISSLIQLQNEDIILIKLLFKSRSVKKDIVLIDKDELSNVVFFINSGYLRYFKITETGEEQTIHLFSSGDFATSFCSFVCNTKSEETLHTLTDSELLYNVK